MVYGNEDGVKKKKPRIHGAPSPDYKKHLQWVNVQKNSEKKATIFDASGKDVKLSKRPSVTFDPE